jgi:hypothetical protein
MDLFIILFWMGVLILLISHILLFPTMPQHATIALVGLIFMFVGSKIGRKFLGIE